MAVNFTMFAGDTKLLQVLVNNVAGNPVDITGTLIRWQLAKNVKSDPALIHKYVGSGVTIVDGPNGRFDVLLDPVDTLPLIGSYYYEAEIDDSGVISTVLTGSVQINQALIDPIGQTVSTGAVSVIFDNATVFATGTVA
jgi:hypothetical protein